MGNETSFQRVVDGLVYPLFHHYAQGRILDPIGRRSRKVYVEIQLKNHFLSHEFDFELDAYSYRLLESFAVFFNSDQGGIAVVEEDDHIGMKVCFGSCFIALESCYLQMKAFLLFMLVYNLYLVPLAHLETVALSLQPNFDIMDCENEEFLMQSCEFVNNTLNLHHLDQFVRQASQDNMDAYVEKELRTIRNGVYNVREYGQLLELFLRASWSDQLRKDILVEPIFKPPEAMAWHYHERMFDWRLYDLLQTGKCDLERRPPPNFCQVYHFKIMEVFLKKVVEPLCDFLRPGSSRSTMGDMDEEMVEFCEGIYIKK